MAFLVTTAAKVSDVAHGRWVTYVYTVVVLAAYDCWNTVKLLHIKGDISC